MRTEITEKIETKTIKGLQCGFESGLEGDRGQVPATDDIEAAWWDSGPKHQLWGHRLCNSGGSWVWLWWNDGGRLLWHEFFSSWSEREGFSAHWLSLPRLCVYREAGLISHWNWLLIWLILAVWSVIDGVLLWHCAVLWAKLLWGVVGRMWIVIASLWRLAPRILRRPGIPRVRLGRSVHVRFQY